MIKYSLHVLGITKNIENFYSEKNLLEKEKVQNHRPG